MVSQECYAGQSCFLVGMRLFLFVLERNNGVDFK